jgi:hypothetical protein
MMKETMMKENTGLTGSFQPTGDSGLTMTRTTDEARDIAAFGQKHQNQHDAILSSLQAIQGRVKAAGEAFVTPQTFPGLNMIIKPAFTIPDDCV